MLTLLLNVWSLMHYFYFEKRQPQEKAVLFGYPIVSIRCNGIIINAETLAGGWYELIYDYLILSHYILETSLRPSPILPTSAPSCGRDASQHLEKGKEFWGGVIVKILKLHNLKGNNVLTLFVEDFVWLSHCLNKTQWDNDKRWNPYW